MQIAFASKDLEMAFTKGKSKYFSKDIVLGFIKKVTLIQEAKNENDLRSFKSLHFEKLQGKDDQYSIRINDQYRLIFSFEQDQSIKIVLIQKISKHYES